MFALEMATLTVPPLGQRCNNHEIDHEHDVIEGAIG